MENNNKKATILFIVIVVLVALTMFLVGILTDIPAMTVKYYYIIGLVVVGIIIRIIISAKK